MAHSIRFSSSAAALAIAALLAAAAPVHAQQRYAAPPIDEGQQYFMATHSFNLFIGRNGQAGPIELLAQEAELMGHENLGIQMIGGSTPMQHWTSTGTRPSVFRSNTDRTATG